MKKLLVINVLGKDSYQDCHIKGSISIPLDEIKEVTQGWDQDQSIVVYCASYVCSASRRAWHLLGELGFKYVKAYEGGMAEWVQKGLPTEGACAMDYLSKDNLVPKANVDKAVQEISSEELLRLMKSAKSGCSSQCSHGDAGRCNCSR